MKRVILLAALFFGLCACSKKAETSKNPPSHITKEAIESVKSKLKMPMPLDDAKEKIIVTLGEPTSKEGSDLIWAGIVEEYCNELVLTAKDKTAIGMSSQRVHRVVESEYAKCKAHTGK